MFYEKTMFTYPYLTGHDSVLFSAFHILIVQTQRKTDISRICIYFIAQRRSNSESINKPEKYKRSSLTLCMALI